MTNLIKILFLFTSTVVCGQASKLEIKTLDILDNNKIVSLTNSRSLSEGEYKSLDSLYIKNFGGLLNKSKTFKLTVNNKDSAYFFADNLNFYLKLDDSTFYKLPNFQCEKIYQLEEVLTIAFDHINSDDYTDIIIIAQFFSGFGSMDIKYKPIFFFDIFFGSTNGFHNQQSLFHKLDFSSDSLMTVNDIKNNYRKK